jgi:hypothetical protein
MTRIKKRRSGKKKTSDQQKSAAGKRRARSAEKTASLPVEQDATSEPVSKKALPHKKKYKAPIAGRRGGRAAEKAAAIYKEQHTKDNTTEKKPLPYKKPTEPGKQTGKTRSAGSRRIAVAKSVATSFKGKPANKKSIAPKKETSSEGKPAKGFAPWNKNRKFKKKDKNAQAGQPSGKKQFPGKKSFRK